MNFFSTIDFRMERIAKDLESFCRSHSGFFFFTLLIGVISFAFELFNFSLSVDNEFWIRASVSPDWLDQGRWGMYLVNCLYQSPGVPFVTLFLTLALISAGWVSLITILHQENNPGKYWATFIFMASPYFLFSYVFFSLCLGIGVGVLLAVVTLYCFQCPSWWVRGIGVFIGAFTIGIYQTFAVFILTLCCIFILNRIVSRPIRLSVLIRQFSVLLALIVMSVVAYFLLNRLAMYLARTCNTSYIDGLKKEQTAIWLWLKEILFIIRDGFAYYWGRQQVVGVVLTWQGILLSFSLVCLIGKLCGVRHRSALRILEGALFAALTLVMPFILFFILKQPPLRSMIAVPLVISLLFLLGYPLRPQWRVLAILISLLCWINYLYVNSKLSFDKFLNWQADKVIATNLTNMIAQASPSDQNFDINAARKLIVIGCLDRNDQCYFFTQETIGASLFNWDGGCPHRISAVFRSLGYPNITAASPSEYQKYFVLTRNMPCFPAAGSVMVKDRIIIIKFSEASGTQIQRNNLCQRIVYHPAQDGIFEYFPQEKVKNFIPPFFALAPSLKNYQLSARLVPVGNSYPPFELEVQTRGPTMILYSAPTSGRNALLEIDITVPADDLMAIYYLTNEKDQYIGARGIALNLKNGRNHFFLNIPSRYLYHLRIDPCRNILGRIKIDKIALYNND